MGRAIATVVVIALLPACGLDFDRFGPTGGPADATREATSDATSDGSTDSTGDEAVDAMSEDASDAAEAAAMDSGADARPPCGVIGERCCPGDVCTQGRCNPGSGRCH